MNDAGGQSALRRMPAVDPDEEGGPPEHPGPKGPRLFADSATWSDIESLFRTGIINGITTNPRLLREAGAGSWDEAKAILRDLCALLRPHPVSLKLTETTVDDMVRQAEELAKFGDNAVIEVPIGGYRAINPGADPYTGIKVIRRLWERGIKVNTTLVFNTTQALWAANSGALFVSPFLSTAVKRGPDDTPCWVDGPSSSNGGQIMHDREYAGSGGPLKDAGARLIFEIATVFADYELETEILAASSGSPVQVTECLRAGADVLTVPAAVLATAADHSTTSGS